VVAGRALVRACFLLALAGISSAGGVGAQESVPFRTRNLSPLVSIFALPTWEPAPRSDRLEVGVVSEVANHFRLARSGADTLILDGETWRTSLFLGRTLSGAWSFGAELPFYKYSGGVLDDLIDGWHSAFNLPDGGRNNRPDGLLRFQLAGADGRLFDMQRPAQGLGDVRLSLARRIGTRRPFLIRGTLKLPTGDAGILSGSGAADAALTIFKDWHGAFRRRPAGLYSGLGILRLGEPTAFDYRNKDVVYIGMLGVGWRVARRVGFKAQLNGHTAFYDSPLRELGETAVQATLGAWWTRRAGRTLEFAIVEDLTVGASPDVLLHLGYRWSRETDER
jgi:hypothetical protein